MKYYIDIFFYYSFFSLFFRTKPLRKAKKVAKRLKEARTKAKMPKLKSKKL